MLWQLVEGATGKVSASLSLGAGERRDASGPCTVLQQRGNSRSSDTQLIWGFESHVNSERAHMVFVRRHMRCHNSSGARLPQRRATLGLPHVARIICRCNDRDATTEDRTGSAPTPAQPLAMQRSLAYLHNQHRCKNRQILVLVNFLWPCPPLKHMRAYRRKEYVCAISLLVSLNIAGIPSRPEVSAIM